MGVMKIFAPHPSASKLSSPPGVPDDGGEGSRREVMAWIPCNVPVRIKIALSGKGGNASGVRCETRKAHECGSPLYNLLKTNPPALLMTHKEWTVIVGCKVLL